ncbi:TRAP transporter large permease [Sulfitobacter sp. MOLA879]|uniref:TRAP transporter large permease n=1 Tax=Sulfitobacter sp. MOLA879 TaxID=3368579 RepID=UPI0037468650
MSVELLLPIALLFVMLGCGLWIMSTLLAVALVTMLVSADLSLHQAGTLTARILAGTSRSWELSAVPLFLLMGELLLLGGTSKRLFAGLSPIVERLRGGHLHINIAGSVIFAAVSGSSTATTATVGRVSLPELDQRGYAPRLSLGSLAASGSLGLLVPPSIAMIVYGVIAEASIARLFAAGVIPGVLIAGAFSAYVMVTSGKATDNRRDTAAGSWRSILGLLPIFCLIGVVLGSIYTGIASPTEAAAVGASGAFVLVILEGNLSRAGLWRALTSTALLSSAIVSIVVAASILSTGVGMAGIPQDISVWINGLGLGYWGLLIVLGIIYIVLGLFLDGISIMVLTLPIVLPLVSALNIDLIWFGIFLIVLIEMGLITPPVGLNLFVVQSISKRDMPVIARAVLPFFLIMLSALVVFAAVPSIVTWLPGALFD